MAARISTHPAETPQINRQRLWWGRALFGPVDIAPLVFFRIFFGGMMLYHIGTMAIDRWIDFFYIRPDFHFSYPGFGWVQPWPGNGMYIHFAVLGVAAACISLGLFYRLSATLFCLGYTYVFLLEKALYQNHCYLICLLSGLMIFVPCHRACSMDVWLRLTHRSGTAPAWSLNLLRFQLAIPYFYGGLAKLNGDWLQAQPMRLWLVRRNEIPLIGPWLSEPWMPWVFAYGGLLFDLLIIPALLWRRTRLAAYCASLVFHLMNALLWDIGVFPWFMIGATLLFFPPARFRQAVTSRRVTMAEPAGIEYDLNKPGRRLTVAALCVFATWQLLFPFRHFLYPGNVSWTEEGHHFAWHMMLREKDVGIRFYVFDPVANRRGLLKVRDFLNSRQLSRMGKDPDMVIEFVHHVRDHYREKGETELQIHVLNIASLNGRKPQLLMDPKVDYAAVERQWNPQPWVTPLQEPLRKEGWSVPLDRWEQVLDLKLPDLMQGQQHSKVQTPVPGEDQAQPPILDRESEHTLKKEHLDAVNNRSRRLGLADRPGPADSQPGT